MTDPDRHAVAGPRGANGKPEWQTSQEFAEALDESTFDAHTPPHRPTWPSYIPGLPGRHRLAEAIDAARKDTL